MLEGASHSNAQSGCRFATTFYIYLDTRSDLGTKGVSYSVRVGLGLSIKGRAYTDKRADYCEGTT